MGSSFVVAAPASAAAFYYPAAFSPASYPSAELLPGCIYQTDKCNNYPAKDLIRLIALSGYACSQQKFNINISGSGTRSAAWHSVRPAWA
jgi:hypothetical protein